MESLQEVKTRLGDSYLDEDSVQAFGISRVHNAIRVYVEPGSSTELSPLIDKIKHEAEPYEVIVIESEAATAH